MGVGVLEMHEGGLRLPGKHRENRRWAGRAADIALRQGRRKNAGKQTKKRPRGNGKRSQREKLEKLVI